MATQAGAQKVDPYKAKNHDEAPLPVKIDDLLAFISQCKFGMLTTKLSGSETLISRCMALAAKESGGIDLLFHTNLFSHKTADISSNPTSTNMSFLDQVSGSWASISGTAAILQDQDLVKKYYSPSLQVWLGDLGDGVHDGGPDDPRIGIIRLEAKTITYSIAKKGAVKRAVETVKGAAKGEVPEVNLLREISEEELMEWRMTHTEEDAAKS